MVFGNGATAAWENWNIQVTTQATSVGTTSINVWQTRNAGTTPVSFNTGAVWIQWNSIHVVTAGTTSNVWTNWNGNVGLGNVRIQAPAFVHRETKQERDARVAAELRAAEQRKVDEAQRKIAAERARKLLLETLTEEQRRELAERRHFHLRTRSGRLFRVQVGQGRSHNVKEIVEGRIVKSYCAYPVGDIPEDDAILGQKLALEHDEGEFLRLAYSRDEVRAA